MCGLEKTSSRDTCSMSVLADCASWWGTIIPSDVESVEKWRPRFPIHLESSSGTSSRATVVPAPGVNTSSASPLLLTDILNGANQRELSWLELEDQDAEYPNVYSTCRQYALARSIEGTPKPRPRP